MVLTARRRIDPSLVITRGRDMTGTKRKLRAGLPRLPGMCDAHRPAFRQLFWSTQDADLSAKIDERGTAARIPQNRSCRVHGEALPDSTKI